MLQSRDNSPERDRNANWSPGTEEGTRQGLESSLERTGEEARQGDDGELPLVDRLCLDSRNLGVDPTMATVAVAAAAALVVAPVAVTPVAAVIAPVAAVVAAAVAVSPLVDPDHRSEQSISSLNDPFYWERCCPWLHCRRDSTKEGKDEATGEDSVTLDEADKTKELISRGFFKIDGKDLKLPEGLCERLARGAVRLVELGHSASALFCYDEAWDLQAHVGPSISRITGNPLSGDCYSFFVTAERPSGFTGAHRDKPCGTLENSFRADDESPKYITCWIALTPATPSTSCLYFVPKGDDVGYFVEGDALDQVLPDPHSWQNIVAAPCETGDLLCFSHRVVHWASKARAGQREQQPRIALSFAAADTSFERPNFDTMKKGKYPPLALRVGLIAAQAILYSIQVPLHKYELALNNRIFMASRAHFSKTFVDRIQAEAQYLKFKLRHDTIARNIDASRK